MQYVCEYMDVLLRVDSTHLVLKCVSFPEHVHEQMSRNGFLNTAVAPIAPDTNLF